MAEEDVIFGKNRHYYGGIEPSNMLAVSVTQGTNHPLLSWTLPGNTVVEDQTLCTCGGAMIRRKQKNYPTDEFDGDLVANVDYSGSLTDTTADNTGTYYYQWFPYSEQGIYNNSKANRVVFNEPNPMTAFTAKSVYVASTDTINVEIVATLPDGAAGAMIRKSTSGYPADETDGTLVENITESKTITETNVEEGTIIYYAAFPYTATGDYNRDSSKNRASVTPKKRVYFYGYDLTIADSNPATRVSYPDDVDNANFTAAKMGSSTFDYGDWPSTPGEGFMPRPCMLKYDGTVDYYLDPDDYTKKEDGTTSDVANTSYGGNAMVEWGKIWTKRWEENGVYHFRCCDVQLDDNYECWSNYDKNNNQIDRFYTPCYFGSNVSSKLRSLSGQSNSVSTTATTEITYATANGDDWYTEVVADWFLIQDLLVLMGKSTDGQSTFGQGRCSSSNSSAINTGTMNDKGMFWGSTNKTSGVKVFGMENWWGNVWRRTAGWICKDSKHLIKLTRGTHDGSTATDYNTDGTGYISTGLTGPSSGYISDCTSTNYGRLATASGGSATTYECDYIYKSSGTNYALVGGYWRHDSSCGPFYVHLGSEASSNNTNIGAALSCKPSSS